MNKKIKVFENVFNEDFFYTVYNDIINRGWFKSRTSNNSPNTTNIQTFWSQPTDIDNIFYREDSTYHRPILKESAKIIQQLLEKELQQKLFCWRVAVNGQTYGQNGSLHTDMTDSNDNFYTVVFFANSYWESEWGGELIVHDNTENKNIINYYSCKPNNAVMFPSSYLHVGRGPNRECYELRISVAYGFCTEDCFSALRDKNISVIPL